MSRFFLLIRRWSKGFLGPKLIFLSPTVTHVFLRFNVSSGGQRNRNQSRSSSQNSFTTKLKQLKCLDFCLQSTNVHDVMSSIYKKEQNQCLIVYMRFFLTRRSPYIFLKKYIVSYQMGFELFYLSKEKCSTKYLLI